MRHFAAVAGLLSFGLGWCLPLGARAQSAPPLRVRTTNVKADVVPLLTAGYQLSAEKLFGPTYRHALVVTPQLYHGPVSELTSALNEGRNDRVRGAGLAVQHRIYLGARTTPLDGFYVGYGLSYQHFNMHFQESSWQNELAPNGLYYYQYRLRDQHETIRRYGASVVLGEQFFLPETPLFLDFYFGLGFRQATSRSTLPGTRYHNSMSDYGAEGVYVPLGLRLGIAW